MAKDKVRKPNMVDGVDEIRDEKDLEHFLYDFHYTGDKKEYRPKSKGSASAIEFESEARIKYEKDTQKSE